MIDLNNPAHPSHSNHCISTKGYRAQRVWNHKEPLKEITIDDLIKDWLEEPVEQCGFIDSKHEIWYVKNIHKNPINNFLMDSKETVKILKEIYSIEKNKVLGIFHTHPNNVPWPSPRDIVGWPNPQLNWRYFIVTQKEVIEWELTRD